MTRLIALVIALVFAVSSVGLPRASAQAGRPGPTKEEVQASSKKAELVDLNSV